MPAETHQTPAAGENSRAIEHDQYQQCLTALSTAAAGYFLT